jgi:excinuclease UvrABC ATPase subunit
MAKTPERPVIRLRGVRQNNLKNIDLDLPIGSMVVITGVSGSGKSSLAFETLYAEGQRRYIETFSPYARQFFDRMDRPQVDSIQGIPPAIAIEQRNAVKTTRSTVGTMTEICDYMKMAWPHLAELHCRSCGQRVRKDAPENIWARVWDEYQRASGNAVAESDPDILITFDIALSDRLSLTESLALIAGQGYQRLLIRRLAEDPDNSGSRKISEPGTTRVDIVRLDEWPSRLQSAATKNLTVVQDRLKLSKNGPSSIRRCLRAGIPFWKRKTLRLGWRLHGGVEVFAHAALRGM